ncbi:MAG TPA: hypothetical protein VGQ56_03635 [Gemmatimonadaceae bacterium]|nr:hypothetical protein [Gemmatimonadaceae bacterium]
MQADSELRAALTRDLDGGISVRAKRVTDTIVAAFGDQCLAVLHYGSHSHSTSAPASSAYDFFVIVDDNAKAFRRFVAHRQPHFSARTASTVARVLPPNIIGVLCDADEASQRVRGKCAVLSLNHFAAACGSRSKDHFTKGRLSQPARLAWVRDAAARRAVEDALVDARSHTFAWVSPYLPEMFDTPTYCRTLLSTSFAAEIRVENSTRAAELFAMEQDVLLAMYEPLLSRLVADGVLRVEGNAYRATRIVSSMQRSRVRWYFRRSKLRAMMRWSKSVLLYDRWLDYLREKAERRTGVGIELSPRERRWPFIFLWARALRVLVNRR